MNRQIYLPQATSLLLLPTLLTYTVSPSTVSVKDVKIKLL